MGYREEDVITLDNTSTILLDAQDAKYCTEDINNGNNRILYGNFTADRIVKVDIKLEELVWVYLYEEWVFE